MMTPKLTGGHFWIEFDSMPEPGQEIDVTITLRSPVRYESFKGIVGGFEYLTIWVLDQADLHWPVELEDKFPGFRFFTLLSAQYIHEGNVSIFTFWRTP